MICTTVNHSCNVSHQWGLDCFEMTLFSPVLLLSYSFRPELSSLSTFLSCPLHSLSLPPFHHSPPPFSSSLNRTINSHEHVLTHILTHVCSALTGRTRKKLYQHTACSSSFLSHTGNDLMSLFPSHAFYLSASLLLTFRWRLHYMHVHLRIICTASRSTSDV